MMKKSQILIVDDDDVSCELLKAFLLPEGYETECVHSGDEALKIMSKFKPDTMLLDVLMEGMDGLELCQRIKSNEDWENIPLILITSLDSKEDLSRGIDAGADDYLQKPVNRLELRSRVKSMLRIKNQFDELQEMLHLREDLANMIMHDMKNPLAAVLMASQLLQLKIKTPQELKYIDTIQVQSRRLESLMNDILMLAKMKEGKLTLNKETIDINEVLEGIEAGFHDICQHRGINFRTELLNKPHEVSIDINLFQRVLENLISNSIKFSPDNSIVTLKAELIDSIPGKTLSKASLRIKVIDQGHGIPEENREDIFDKFKVSPIKRKGISQLGLGLAFCKMVVNVHGGKIFVLPNEPKGSVFVIEI